MFLEEKDIDVSCDLCQAGIACKITLFNGYAPKLTFVRGKVTGYITLLFGEIIQPGLVGTPDFLLHLVNLCLHILNGRVIFSVFHQKGSLLHLEARKLLCHPCNPGVIIHNGW